MVEGVRRVKQVLVKSGRAAVEDVPAPGVSPRSVLVRVAYSCVSPGTEGTNLKLSGLPLYRRALKQPDHVRRVLEVGREQGFKRTFDRVRGQLAAGLPVGYSAAGTVIAVGDEVAAFAVGDPVACAGAGVANHAEVIDVPVNLAVKVPEGLELEAAATVTLGAIALQGVRRAAPTLGETIGVIGLGLIGQLTAQLLRANGCRVIGADVDPHRVERALEDGMTYGVLPGDDFVDRTHKVTGDFGADAVIITAATGSSEVVQQAMRACRKKGRVVLVGDVGLHLRRSDFYEKELDFLMSTSYGPGRYDDVYEQEGRDYPLGYVRWTENRNMEEYLRLLAEDKISLANLDQRTYEVDEAREAYSTLDAAGAKPLLLLLSYPERPAAVDRMVKVRQVTPRAGRIRVAVVGAGSFAQGTHIPNLLKLKDSFELRCVMSRTGSNAATVAEQSGAAYATTDYKQVLADDDIDLVLIATRHNLHAELTLGALEAGKNVFVEKPLALTPEELDRIRAFYSTRQSPLLMTGFNRRFSPAAVLARELLSGRSTPLIANYRINAGFLPPGHWVHGSEGGGRNVGEAVHAYDLFDYLVGDDVITVEAHGIRPWTEQWHASDNFVSIIRYNDGSVCTLSYTALGHKDHPKEQLEIFAEGRVIVLDDYRRLVTSGGPRKGWRARRAPAKGHLEEFQALSDCLRRGGGWPISLEEQLRATRISFEVESRIRNAPLPTQDGQSVAEPKA
jgi:predicted dehydrogenase/threonine dehydrogenase-like Zn-dependent dehydrogenase